MLSESNLGGALALLKLSVRKLCFFIERVNDLSEQLFFGDAVSALGLDIGLGAFEECVEFLVLGLGATLGRLAKVAQDIELEKQFK